MYTFRFGILDFLYSGVEWPVAPVLRLGEVSESKTWSEYHIDRGVPSVWTWKAI